MKTIGILAAALVLSVPAFAQKVGPYVTAGGGMSALVAGSFSVTNSVAATTEGENLPTQRRHSNVGVARLTAGYNFTDSWSVQISYARFGAGEVTMTFPEYPDVVWGIGGGPDKYQRHSLVFKPTSISIMPVYTHAVDHDTRIILGAGLTRSTVTSHFETTYESGATIAPELVHQANTYADESESKITPVLTLGWDKKITDQFSIGITGTYTSMEMKIPTAPWSKRSAETVGINSFEAVLYVGWHL